MRIRTMTAADIPRGLTLSAQNGWNQLEADWRRQLELDPAGCFLAERDGVGVGTACACVFGDVAWIALVLVDVHQRGQGVGTLLMKHTLDWLDRQGVPSIRLDATPLGRPIYEKLGFRAEFTLHRYAGPLQPIPGTTSARPACADDLTDVIALDRQVTRTDRSRLIERLFHEQPAELRVVRRLSGSLDGFVYARPGARAWQIGPCAGSQAACRDLLVDVSQRHAGAPAFLDVPDQNAEVNALAGELGLTVARDLLRMGRGPRVHEELAMLWTGFGPEKG